MKIKKLAETLEDIKSTREDDIEHWSARDLYPLLGYKTWENFQNAINRAIKSCKKSENDSEYHFLGATKMVDLGSGSQRKIDDYELTRYACYLIAQNGDPRIPEIAFAQMYFAVQTRRQEKMQSYVEEIERLIARQKLRETNKDFARTILERDVDSAGLAEITSVGDYVLFGSNSTKDMKRLYRISSSRALADFLPTVTIKAKDLASEATTYNTNRRNLIGKDTIKGEHIKSNESARAFLLDLDIIPEHLPPEEDIKKVERRYVKQMKLMPKTGGSEKLSARLDVDVPIGITRSHFIKLKEILMKRPGSDEIRLVFGDKTIDIPFGVEITEELGLEIIDVLNSDS